MWVHNYRLQLVPNFLVQRLQSSLRPLQRCHSELCNGINEGIGLLFKGIPVDCCTRIFMWREWDRLVDNIPGKVSVFLEKNCTNSVVWWVWAIWVHNYRLQLVTNFLVQRLQSSLRPLQRCHPEFCHPTLSWLWTPMDHTFRLIRPRCWCSSFPRIH